MKNKNKKCQVPQCDKDAVCKGYCTKHYQQMKLNGKILEKNYTFIEGMCKIIGCGKKVFAKDLCQKHYLKQN
jgi:hypothetical protein